MICSTDRIFQFALNINHVSCCCIYLLGHNLFFTMFFVAVRVDSLMQLWAFHQIIPTALLRLDLHQRCGIQMVGYVKHFSCVFILVLWNAAKGCIDIRWHAVYPDGRVCISILHAPGEDPNGYELASERWTPVHTVSIFTHQILPFNYFPKYTSHLHRLGCYSYYHLKFFTLLYMFRVDKVSIP